MTRLIPTLLLLLLLGSGVAAQEAKDLQVPIAQIGGQQQVAINTDALVTIIFPLPPDLAPEAAMSARQRQIDCRIFEDQSAAEGNFYPFYAGLFSVGGTSVNGDCRLPVTTPPQRISVSEGRITFSPEGNPAWVETINYLVVCTLPFIPMDLNNGDCLRKTTG